MKLLELVKVSQSNDCYISTRKPPNLLWSIEIKATETKRKKKKNSNKRNLESQKKIVVENYY